METAIADKNIFTFLKFKIGAKVITSETESRKPQPLMYSGELQSGGKDSCPSRIPEKIH